MEKEEISYSELARRVGDCVLNNEIMPELETQGLDFEVVNGDMLYCYKHETPTECEQNEAECDYELRDVYQTYIITQSGAEYLQRNTEEIVYYCEKLDLYLWGLTHFGTSWTHVFTKVKVN